MDVFYWLLVTCMFILSFVGLIYPIIPSVLFLVLGFVAYGLLFDFSQLTIDFWLVQGLFIIILLTADYFTNLVGVKKYGGSKAAIWGSTIGLMIGPFLIPFIGILLGPFIGAVVSEMLFHKKSLASSIRIGFGSLIGFISGVVAKSIIQIIMIIYFFYVILI